MNEIKEKALAKLLEELNQPHDNSLDRVHNWICDQEDEELFKGILVEKEKRYLVKMKGIEKEKCYLNYNFGGVWLFYNQENFYGYRAHHTRKELEEANFGWVFDCPGIDIEEVE